MKNFNFKTIVLLVAMLLSVVAFYGCDKEDDNPDNNNPSNVTPDNQDPTPNPDPTTDPVAELSESIKNLSNAVTDGKPVELALDEKTTDEDVKTIVQALAQNEKVEVSLDLTKTAITSVPAEAFKEVKNLATIVLPEKVTTIGDNAFKDCATLRNVILKESISKAGTTIKIGKSAFENCAALDSVNIPLSAVETIEIDPTAFEGTNIALLTGTKFTTFADVKTFAPESVLILANVTEIPDGAFYKVYPYEFTPDDGGATETRYKYDSTLVSVKFADGSKLTKIGNGAFGYCEKMENLTLPGGVKEIGNESFFRCISWKNPSIPESVEAIGDEAFYLVNMGTNFVAPSTVKKWGRCSFYYSDNGIYGKDTYSFADLNFSVRLKNGGLSITKLPIVNDTIVIPNDWIEIPLRIGWNGDVRDIKGLVFEKNSSVEKIMQYQFVDVYMEQIEIPASVRELDSLALSASNSLEKVTFEKGSKLEKVAPNAFIWINWWKFPSEIHLPIFCELTGGWGENEPLPEGTKIVVPANLVEQFKAADCYKACEIIAEEE
ncbi:MAG: leucine-rich repeat domain-containing protein [Bacteroidales bacterium]|nr:leucine-rich repeat domain-containing protein [Bacteroidales bacterium]